MVEGILQTGTESRRLARGSLRTQIGWVSAVADLFAIVGSYLVADVVRVLALSSVGSPPARLTPDWSSAVLVLVVVSVFFMSGLYELEAYVSRSLHLWTLLRASLVVFAISALALYAIRADVFEQPWPVLVATFVAFVAFAAALRLIALDTLCGAMVRRRKPVFLLVGESDLASAVADRLAGLKAFGQVQRVKTVASKPGVPQALRSALEGGGRTGAKAASVFIDGSSMTPREVSNAAAAAQTFGAEVYVASGLLEALEVNRLLTRLFGVPTTRLRRSIDNAKPYPLKRVFDMVGSAILLVVCLPAIAVLGVLIRSTSPGPVFHKQTRVGRFGVPFEFLKLRSMIVNGDVSIHSEYVHAFMNGSAEAVAVAPGGEVVFKRVNDPRITSVGRFIRKYSLDEIPQFWNVFRGDMSLVGPRPSLPYEANEYDDWDSLRLTVPAGITGLWQVEGRSRVSFDEMVLQDQMYAQNMRLLVDLKLCLMTLPAALLKGGGG